MNSLKYRCEEKSKNRMLSKEVVLMPICANMHWFHAIIYPKRKTVSMYDSFGSTMNEYGQKISSWARRLWSETDFVLESTDWCVESVSETELSQGRVLQRQRNAHDCGIFICKAAEALSLRTKLSFRQEDLRFIRLRLCAELLTGKAVGIHPTRLSFIRGDSL